MAFGEIFLRDTAGSPEQVRWLHLARSGSQSLCAIWFILPTHGACHITNNITKLPWFYCCLQVSWLAVLSWRCQPSSLYSFHLMPCTCTLPSSFPQSSGMFHCISVLIASYADVLGLVTRSSWIGTRDEPKNVCGGGYCPHCYPTKHKAPLHTRRNEFELLSIRLKRT